VAALESTVVLLHAPGGRGLRWLGLGPGLRPLGALRQLQALLDQHSFWATGRRLWQLRTMVAGSTVVVTAWQGRRLVGFGRATSDGVFRATLWDVVVATDQQGCGIGRLLVDALLRSRPLRSVERVYLMTTQSSGFYQQLGFGLVKSQNLLVKKN
jgi:ribosomal protein S18 acetylase RimI-like enzyme